MNKTIPITDNQKQLEKILLVISTLVDSEKPHEVIIQPVPKNKRSLLQNASIFVYYTRIAEQLNESGQTMRSFFSKLKKGFEIPVSKDDVRKVAEKVSLDMYNKPVKELNTVEIQELHKVVDRGFSLSMGVSHEFPNNEPPLI